VRITYVLTDGERREVDAKSGTSLMEAALKNNIKGIDAECGGCLSCATCHVYVDEAWVAKLPAPEPDETDMLGFVAAEQKPNSRLSCQLVMSESLDGIVVSVPDRQS
jgi:ferredoxin, 2Fe-2S